MDSYYRKLLKQQAIEDRCIAEAEWLIDNPNTSIRQLAREFNISKSQVQRDLNSLKHINDDLYVQCRNILKKHLN